MTLLFAATIGVLFACGAYLMLKADLFRVVAGVVLISNAANLTLMSAGLTRGAPPMHPLPDGEPISDPLVQAMTLTAIVIGLAVGALLLGLVYRVYVTHSSVDLDELSRKEASSGEEPDRDEVPV